MSESAILEKPTPAQSPEHARRWWALAVIAIAQLMVVLDATIVNIALPAAQKDLGFSQENRQWIVTAYALAFGSLLLLGGRIADLFGRKPVFLTGIVGFGVASAIGGAAGNFEMLVVARVLQGIFAAMLAPAALSLLTTTFTDPGERNKAFGVFGAVAGSGGAVGLLLGGVLTEHLNWRWTLYVNLPIAAVALVGGLMFLVHHKDMNRPKLDIPGTIVVSLGLFLIVYGFSNAEPDQGESSAHWGDFTTWGFLLIGVLLLALFARMQSRTAHPLLPLRVLADRNRAASFISVGIAGAGMFGVFMFLVYYLQTTLGYSPVKTGLSFLPMIGALMVTATLATAVLLGKFGPRLLVTAGMVLGAVGMVLLTRLDLDSTYAANIVLPLILTGLGMGLIIAPGMNVATMGVEPQDSGVASATVNTTQQVGGSIGLALLSTLFASSLTGFLDGKNAGDPLTVAQAQIEGYATAYWWSAGFFAVGAVAAWFLYKPGVIEADPNAGPAVHM